MNSKHMGLLVSITGFDGVGKSTQVDLLQNYLKSKNKKVHTTEAMFSYFLMKPLVKVLRRTSGSMPGGPVKRNNNILVKFWFILAFIDIWLMFIFSIQSLRKKYDFIVADRFYTDIWANLLYYGYIPEWAFRLFIRLLPKSDLAFILWIHPEIVLKREREFPAAYYIRQAKIYKQLISLADFKIINADQEPKLVFKEIRNILDGVLKKQK